MEYKIFEIKGKIDVPTRLEGLRKQGIKRIYPLTEDQRKDPKETFIYKINWGIIDLYMNYEIDIHEIGIGVRRDEERYLEILENTKSTLENTLETKLIEKEEENGKETRTKSRQA